MLKRVTWQRKCANTRFQIDMIEETVLMEPTDKDFYDRADAHISLANEQIAVAGQIPTNSAFMYSVSRFNAWVVASGFENADEMKFAKAGALEYFVNQYKEMLDEHLDDYIANFDAYTKTPDSE